MAHGLGSGTNARSERLVYGYPSLTISISQRGHAMEKVKRLKVAPELDTPIDLPTAASRLVTTALNEILADTFVLYVKTKNFHWHVSGPHFRDYHLMFDEQAEQIFSTTDELAERVRKIGGTTVRSLGHITKLTSLTENNEGFVEPHDMLRELIDDHQKVVAKMRKAHKLAEDHEDVATASLLENFIDGTERRLWFLFETSRRK
jgi:starvation-inducible DNA-binding protein